MGKSGELTESCLNHNISDRAVAHDGWNSVLSRQSAVGLQDRGDFISLLLDAQTQSKLPDNVK